MLALCAAMLALLAACSAGRDAAGPEPAPSQSAAAAPRLPKAVPNQKRAGQEPSEEPVEEPEEEPNPIPLFVPDPDPEDPGAGQTPEPVRIYVPIPYIKSENAAPAVSRKTSDPDQFGEEARYLGRWIIQSCGIDVACYLSYSQDVVDGQDAAAFFQMGDQYIIGDHSNQDFERLSACRPGDLACLETEEGIAVYVCTAAVQGHNSEKTITDDAGNSIEYGFNPGGITCYTCNDKWQNIHIILFSPIA